jgi:hypothetical protein
MPKGSNREGEFSKEVKDQVSKRADWRCSRCRKQTLRPSEGNETGSRSSGQVGHIVSASAGGPRYRALPVGEREAIGNAIYLCTRCHFVVIDNMDNALQYPEDRVVKIKADHEQWVMDNFDNGGVESESEPTVIEGIYEAEGVGDIAGLRVAADGSIQFGQGLRARGTGTGRVSGADIRIERNGGIAGFRGGYVEGSGAGITASGVQCPHCHSVIGAAGIAVAGAPVSIQSMSCPVCTKPIELG